MQSPATFYSELSIIPIRSDQSSKGEVVGLAVCFHLVCPFLPDSLEETAIRHLYFNVNESLIAFGTLCLSLYQKLGLWESTSEKVRVEHNA